MQKKIQHKRGLKKDLPLLSNAELGYVTDAEELYVGTNNKNIRILLESDKISLTNQINTKANEQDMITSLESKANKTDVELELQAKVSDLELSDAKKELTTKIDTVEQKVQNSKITNSDGGVKLSVTTEDILKTIVSGGIGFHTFYAKAGAKNNPAESSIRGIAHISSEGFGWVNAFSQLGSVYVNNLDNGTWRGWEPVNDSNRWVLAALQNGYTHFENDRFLSYRKVLKNVQIKGVVKNTTNTTGAIFTLPMGLRPATTLSYVISAKNAAVQLTVGANGEVAVSAWYTGSSEYVHVNVTVPLD